MVVCLCTIATVVVIGGCASSPKANTSTPANVALNIDVQIKGTTLTVNGTTDLPDQTILTASAFALEGPDTSLTQMSARTDTKVESGQYSAVISLTGWQRGDSVVVAVSFYPSTPGQPKALVDRFGPTGARLQGPGARMNDNDWSTYYEVDTTVTLT